MAAKKKDNRNVVYIFMAIVIVGLMICGFAIIYQSNQAYNQSYKQSDQVTQKILDSAFKKTIAAPVPSYASIKDGYSQALLYFTLAIATLLIALLLPRLQTFNISPTGGISVTLREVQDKVDNLIAQTNNIQGDTAGAGGKKTSGKQLHTLADTQHKDKEKPPHDTGVVPNDPQKGKWGRSPLKNCRLMSATVDESNVPGYYKVQITVESTKASEPLTGLVKFHLHDTFLNANPVIAVQDGKAVLNLSKVYGAFTVGAEADGGKTRLELDLAEDKNFPEAFRNA
jgi:hypothetical protein